MERNGVKSQINNKRIVKILRGGAAWIGLAFIVIGMIFGVIPLEQPSISGKMSLFLNMLSSLCSTGGATFLSVALINFIYEQWRDNEMEETVNGIPEKLGGNITIISRKVASEVRPACPCKIYPPIIRDDNTCGNTSQLLKNTEDVNNIRKDIVTSLKESNKKYLYTGIGMSVISACVSELDSLDAKFLIPGKNCKGLLDIDREAMKKSVEILVDSWQNSHEKFSLEFIFLDFVPSFHIHCTENDCWFAFVDKGSNDTNNQDFVRLPATYQYHKNSSNTDDYFEMYHIIHRMIDDMYKRHKYRNVGFLFDNEGKIRYTNNKGDKHKSIVVGVEKFYKYFNIEKDGQKS